MKRIIPEVVFIISATVYICLLHHGNYPGRFLVKTIPAWALLLSALLNTRGRDRKFLAAGLLLSSFGDMALALQRPGVKEDGIYFMAGLGFFLCAHISYILLFAGQVRFRKNLLPVMTALCMYSLIMAALLVSSPQAIPLIVPILAYLMVITVMGIFSFLRYPASWILPVGAMLFVASDSCLAIDQFMQKFIGAGYYIMITYYLAQYLITKNFTMKKNQGLASPTK
jgi:uncharacterized membrane protein YhhN